MDHLLENWEDIKSLFMNPIFLMTDFDGTLVSIMESPDLVVLSDDLRDLLTQLISYCPIGVISGRPLDDLRDRIKIDDIYHSGNHGFEIKGPDVDFVFDEADRAREAVGKICKKVEGRLGETLDGLIVENKIYTASFHYRLVEESDVPKLKEVIWGETEPYREKNIIEVNHGKKVMEIVPTVEWDKGEAVSLLLRVAGFEEESMPIYLGDDITDESAFSALKWNGIGILVSEERRETDAHFLLNNPEEVKEFFKKLLEVLT